MFIHLQIDTAKMTRAHDNIVEKENIMTHKFDHGRVPDSLRTAAASLLDGLTIARINVSVLRPLPLPHDVLYISCILFSSTDLRSTC